MIRMKVECPVCGVEGILEQRGNSVRVVHYRWADGKRIFSRHTVKVDGNGSKGTVGTMGTDKCDSVIFHDSRGCRLAWSRLVDLGSIDPGSNPGSPTLRSEPDWVRGR